MVAWLIYDEISVEKNKGYIELYQSEGKQLDIEIILILIEKLDFGIKNNQLFLSYENEVVSPDFIICRTIYPLLSVHLEDMGYKVYNNSYVASICNDKAKTYQYIAKLGIGIVDTNFCKYELFNNKIVEFNKNTVVKAVSGHGGSQVYLMNPSNTEEIDIVRDGLDRDNLVIQPLVGNKHQDLRVYVIGKDIVAAVLRTAKEGFKSNFSLGGDVRLYDLKEKELEIVEKIIHAFDFGLVGIDFIISDEGELIFNEIEDVVGSRMLYQCSDINIVNLYLEYIQKDMLCITGKED